MRAHYRVTAYRATGPIYRRLTRSRSLACRLARKASFNGYFADVVFEPSDFREAPRLLLSLNARDVAPWPKAQAIT